MTIDELKKRLNKIDPRLYLECVVSDIDDLNEPTGVWFKAPTKIDWQLFRIDKNDFYFEPLISEIAAVNQFIGLDAVKEVGDLLFKYFEPELSKDSQTISKDSEKENGSTMLSKKITSNDYQKKTKEHLIHDFIKDAALMGFQCSPNQFYDAQTADIDVFDGESKYIMDICFLSGAETFMVDDMEIDDLKRYSWLFTRVSTLISEWRKDEEQKDKID